MVLVKNVTQGNDRGLTVLNVRIVDLIEKCLYEVVYVIINSLSVQQYNEHNFHAL